MFHLAWPWIFLLLPLPLLVYYLCPKRRAGLLSALKVPFLAQLQNLEPSPPVFSHRIFYGLMGLLWGLLLFAAAGPQWLGEPTAIARSGRNIMLAVDLSGSMKIEDMQKDGQPVDRLDIVKDAARAFIHQRSGDRLGLILFGTKAYLQTPLTFDHKTVEAMLDDATIALPGPQTAIGDAIGLAVKRLQEVPEESRVLILLTDGENNAGVLGPLQAAEIAAEHHIKIYTIGIGAKQMLVPGFFGPQWVNPSWDLNEKDLQAIADLTGGLFFRAENDEQLNDVYQAINKLEPVDVDSAIYRPVTEYYYWPLGLALLLSVYLLMRKPE